MDLALPPSLDLDRLLPELTPAEQDSFQGQFDLFMGPETPVIDTGAFQQQQASDEAHDEPMDAATSKHMTQKEKLRSKNRRQIAAHCFLLTFAKHAT